MAYSFINLFGEKAEQPDLLGSNIGEATNSANMDLLTESVNNFSEFLGLLTESYSELISSGDLDDEAFEEATRLSKHINSLNKKEKQLRKNLEELREEKQKYKDNSTEAKMIAKKISSIQDKLGEISKKAEHMGASDGNIDSIDSKGNADKRLKDWDRNSKYSPDSKGLEAKRTRRGNFLYQYDPDTNERKPGDLAKLSKRLKAMGEAVDEILVESNIHGNVTIPGGTSPHPEIDQRPKSSKTEITADVYNNVIGTLQKSFKEMADIVGTLQGAVIVQESTEERIDREQAEYIENAIDQALLEAFENGPIFEAVDRSDKKEVKSIVSKIRGSIASKLKEEDVSYYKPNIVARIIFSMIPAGAELASKAALGKLQPSIGGGVNVNDAAGTAVKAGSSPISVFWKERLWQILGVCHLESGNISGVVKMLNEEYKDDLGSYKILAAKTNATIHDLFKTKFGWKNHKNTYFLLVDKKLPAELKEFQTAVDKAMSSGDKKESEAIKECEEYSLDEYSHYIESVILESMTDEEIEELGDDAFAEAAVLYEFFNTAYIAYTEACKKAKAKKKSKDEFVEDGCKACKESADDEFDLTLEDTPVFEATARKMVKDHTKNIIEAEAAEGGEEAPKKLIRMLANDVARATSKGYRIYAKSCKSSGVKPISKKEFAEKLINEDESFFNSLDETLGGKKIDAAMDKMEKRVSKKYAKYGLS